MGVLILAVLLLIVAPAIILVIARTVNRLLDDSDR